MLPDTGTGGNESTSWVPVNISDTVVISRIHKLQVRSQVLVALWLLTLEIHVKELHFKALLRMNSSNDDETALR